MNRCFPRPSALLRPFSAALLTIAASAAFIPFGAQAQVNGSLGGVRTFPDQARRGTLSILSTVDAKIDGKALRMAPGMRLLSPQNSLIMVHSVIGKEYVVNYTIEPSTAMLKTAWMLNKDEIALPRPGSEPQRNFRFESDVPTR